MRWLTERQIPATGGELPAEVDQRRREAVGSSPVQVQTDDGRLGAGGSCRGARRVGEGVELVEANRSGHLIVLVDCHEHRPGGTDETVVAHGSLALHPRRLAVNGSGVVRGHCGVAVHFQGGPVKPWPIKAVGETREGRRAHIGGECGAADAPRVRDDAGVWVRPCVWRPHACQAAPLIAPSHRSSPWCLRKLDVCLSH